MNPLLTSLRRFLHWEPAPGCTLVLAAVVALVVTNSPTGPTYDALWEHKAGFSVGPLDLRKMTVQLWVNDGLMAVFFFLVGLEIKRELVKGELRDPLKAVLPAVAALGGMLAPACLYALMQPSGEANRGWPIPMATDIAFVVGVLALFGHALPHGLKTFLLTLAIIDDLGAIVLIATLFTEHLSLIALGLAAAGLAAVALCRAAGVRWFAVYLVLGVGVWLAVLKSGVHPTIAGVLLGLLTNTRGSPSPLDRLEHALHPWVYFGVMPVFVLANAGVKIEGALLTHSVVAAVAVGLVVGKPLGIVLMSRLAIVLGWVAASQRGRRQDAARSRLPGRHRLHDVPVPGRPGVQRRTAERQQPRNPGRIGGERIDREWGVALGAAT